MTDQEFIESLLAGVYMNSEADKNERFQVVLGGKIVGKFAGAGEAVRAMAEGLTAKIVGMM